MNALVSADSRGACLAALDWLIDEVKSAERLKPVHI
jgi:hypothetical protein